MLLRRNVWLQMLYFNIYIYIYIYWTRKTFSQTYILTEWTILWPVSESAASFTIRVFNCDQGIMHLKLNGKNRDLVYQCRSNQCRKKQNARENTFFSVSQIHFRVLMQVIIFGLLIRYPLGVISRETGVPSHTLRSILIGL